MVKKLEMKVTQQMSVSLDDGRPFILRPGDVLKGREGGKRFRHAGQEFYLCQTDIKKLEKS